MSHLSLLKFWEVIWDDSLPLLLCGESLRPKFESKKRLVTHRLADHVVTPMAAGAQAGRPSRLDMPIFTSAG